MAETCEKMAAPDLFGSTVTDRSKGAMDGQESFASDFVESLVGEIESLTEGLHWSATTYRGADLRHALARALYFRFVNDTDARHAFRKSRLGPGWLLKRFDPNRNGDFRTALHNFVADSVARPHFPSWSKDSVVFAVIHPKFVRYVRSIGYDRASVFFGGTNDELEKELVKSDITVAHSTRKPFRRLFDARLPVLQAFALQRELDTHLAFLTKQRPRVVVVVEGNSPFDEVMNQACKLAGIPCVCIQQGWSPIIHSGFRHLSFDRMLVWGEEFGRLLAPHSPRQRFVATGSHVVGPAVEGAPVLKGEAISFFLQGRSPLIDDTVWDGFLGLARRVAYRLPNTSILVREHPSEPLDERARSTLQIPNVNCVDPATLPLDEQLARSRIGVSLYSTTLFECVARGVVPVVVNPGLIRSFVPSLAVSGAGVEASSFPDAEAAIVQLSEDNSFHSWHVANHHALVKKLFNGATRAEAAAAICAELDQIS